ncbi:N-acylneuraminate cytidylyltransferase [Synechococcus sp. A18-46.1]|nr:N-acylneuraminate cytidylyltransferase [Synechococcus sp. A18-46.1]
MPSIISLIPARSGSKGVPHKNIRELGGHSLLSWSIKACQISSRIDRTIVSTDSHEYAEHAKFIGAEVPFIRPLEISGDESTDYDFVNHALNFLEELEEKPDYIVHIRPTTPLRDPSLVDDAIDAFVGSSSASSLRSVHLMSESAYKSFEISSSGFLKLLHSSNTNIDSANRARQLFPNTYCANGYVDVLSVKFIEASGLLHGSSVLPFITPHADEIDVEEDFFKLNYKLSVNPIYAQRLFTS